MLINQSFEIDSCDDVELNIKRTSKLEYRISYDDEKEIKAIVFIIGGYGANANIYFLDSYRNYIAKNFDVVTINVFYHCFCQRRSDVLKYDASAKFLEEDLENFSKVLNDFNIDSRNLNSNNALEYYHHLDHYITTLKSQGKLAQNYQAKFTSTFIPPNGDYQNYGVMAAIDHINALKDLVKRFPEFADLPKIYGGGSYGGYLSLLIAKIAPWYVDGVIDNSGVCLPFLAHILGRDMNQGEFVFEGDNNRIYCFVQKYWTRNINSSYYFGDENYLIRAVLNSNHLKIQASMNNNTIFISYHSMQDMGAPVQNKIELYKCYQELGYDATLYLVKDENDIDGRFIKSLEHGLRMTDRALFRKELPLMLEKLQGRKFDMSKNSITYPCKDKQFIFKDKDDKFELEIV
ncbi:DUF2920 family protein [Campylobacter coli]|nr:DUF2920 family protein [Campylobacter coli]